MASSGRTFRVCRGILSANRGLKQGCTLFWNRYSWPANKLCICVRWISSHNASGCFPFSVKSCVRFIGIANVTDNQGQSSLQIRTVQCHLLVESKSAHHRCYSSHSKDPPGDNPGSGGDRKKTPPGTSKGTSVGGSKSGFGGGKGGGSSDGIWCPNCKALCVPPSAGNLQRDWAKKSIQFCHNMCVPAKWTIVALLLSHTHFWTSCRTTGSLFFFSFQMKGCQTLNVRNVAPCLPCIQTMMQSTNTK